MQQCIKILFHIYMKLTTRFGRHTAHHQEPKTAQAASGFAYMEGCWTCMCWRLSGRVYSTPEWDTSRQQTWVNTTRYCKYSQVLLMMSENIARNM